MTENECSASVGNQWSAETHAVENMPPPLCDYNLYGTDTALKEAIGREGDARTEQELTAFGKKLGTRRMIELGFQANENRPVFHSHDPRGRRIDEVRFHPAYHELMRIAVEHGLHASHWSEPGPGAQVSRAAGFYLQTQIEAGHGCPITMTSASIPALRHQQEIYESWAPKILARKYDPRNASYAGKDGLTIGMAMTEKQGGSDVRSNSTVAHALESTGPGHAYALVGHKYFVSAPMCDAFLTLARAPGGLSCFLMPRWRPDGHRNALQIQRLKDKMGNASNATCEAELRGAFAWMIGEEGRGVRTIIDMVAMTRFDCIVGSAAGMRQAVVQAVHHCGHRRAFGKRLLDQPAMQNVLADLAVEQEASLALALRLARALDNQQEEAEDLLLRIGTSIGKFWVCKRTPAHAYEAMECIGGSGYMEESIMPRLFRESPVNAIWEGSGNVQCLDMLRAVHRNPGALDAFFAEVREARGGDRRLDKFVDALAREFRDTADPEYRARGLVEKMAMALQASLLVRFSSRAVADAYCASRLDDANAGWLFGNLPARLDFPAIIGRAAVS